MTMKTETKTFDDSWNHLIKEIERKWHEAIQKEFWDMTKQ